MQLGDDNMWGKSCRPASRESSSSLLRSNSVFPSSAAKCKSEKQKKQNIEAFSSKLAGITGSGSGGSYLADSDGNPSSACFLRRLLQLSSQRGQPCQHL